MAKEKIKPGEEAELIALVQTALDRAKALALARPSEALRSACVKLSLAIERLRESDAPKSVHGPGPKVTLPKPEKPSVEKLAPSRPVTGS